MQKTETENSGTAIAVREYAAQAHAGDQDAIEKVYFHLIRAEEPPAVGDSEPAPVDQHVWTSDDWFDTPAKGMFPGYCGDCQPRHADGGVLQTTERLAIAAACAHDGLYAGDAWANVGPEAGQSAIWITAGETGAAIRVARVEESDQHRAMRDLTGKDGYGRARGTEHIDRPDQRARTTALALHVDEITRGSGVELRRADNGRASDGELPKLAVYTDGGVRATLGRAWAARPSTPDIVDETTAVAIARAYTYAQPSPKRLERAQVAGIIAAHHLVQSAGIRTLATTHEAKVAAWRKRHEERGDDAARNETRAVVNLARKVEHDLGLARTERQFKRWEGRTAGRDSEEPVPAGSGKAPDPPSPPNPARGYAASLAANRDGPSRTI